MGWLTYVADLRAARIVDELAQQLARRTYVAVRETCEIQVPRMSHAEARGYVWAKARPIIVAESRAIAAAHPDLSAAALGIVNERTHDRVVRSVVSDLMRTRTSTLPQRRAA